MVLLSRLEASMGGCLQRRLRGRGDDAHQGTHAGVEGGAYDGAEDGAYNGVSASRWLRVVVCTLVGSLACLLLAAARSSASEAHGEADAHPDGDVEAASVDYVRQIQPILARHCLACHGPDAAARQAELRLDLRESATAELPSGQVAVAPGNAAASGLVARIASGDPSEVMPPPEFGQPLAPEDRQLLQQWIEQGAAYAPHWAYQPPVWPQLPAVSDPNWPRDPLDHFVLAKLDELGWAPAPPAARTTWLRRAALDLTGLPPSDAEVTALLHDQRVDAWERAVDRLLAKPAYGERWAAMWLDLARYADSSGYIHDPPRTIWRWRDELIDLLNRNEPYDRLTEKLLAGDLLTGATPAQVIATGFHRNTMTNSEGGANSAEFQFAAVVDRVNTTMQTWMGLSFACAQCHDHKYDPFTQREYYQLLAVFNNTVDYNSEDPVLEVARIGHEEEYQRLAAALAAARAQRDAVEQQVDAGLEAWLESPAPAGLPDEVAAAWRLAAAERSPQQQALLHTQHRQTSADWRAAEAEVKRWRAAVDRVGTTSLVMKEGLVRPTHIAVRGEFGSWSDRVEPGVPAALHGYVAAEPLDRLQLAQWLVDSRNPLTARVAVNRFWQELFGTGIVESSEEFGVQGELPSHPELLDWLALEYMRSGWDTKRLLKQIVCSATYRQDSQPPPERLERDPRNRWLSSGPRVRLSAEAIRDQALQAAGLLSTQRHGPPAHPHQPTNGLAAAFGSSTDWTPVSSEDAHRRAVYTRWRRNLPYPSMLTFDVPERAVCSARRSRTNTPLQALVTLNDPVFFEAAQGLARRILREPEAEAAPASAPADASQADVAPGKDVAPGGESVLSGEAVSGGEAVSSGEAVPSGEVAKRGARGLRWVLQREPSREEVARVARLFRDARAELADAPQRARALATEPLGPLPADMDVLDAAAWTVVANVLLNLDEALTKY
jgi:hypothetical protein